MDADTAILLVATACAYGWFVSFGILEQRREVKMREQERIEQSRCDKRVRRLSGKEEEDHL